jgi:mannan endo-1,4-beta-mannosidase
MKSVIILAALSLMSATASAADTLPALNDKLATPQTVALYHNLYALGGRHVLFGHHDTLAYGHDWIDEPDRSDVKDVTGDFPAVYGWDMGAVELQGQHEEIKGPRQSVESLLGYARQAYARGGVVTFCWHARNPVTGGAFNDLAPAVHTLLPGGANHEHYKHTLDQFAEFFKQLSPMPVIFRPFHEHNGDWFWWGKGHASEADYIALWRFTETYLRDVKGVHNLIYAISPDRSRIDLNHGEADYFYGYPGDEYVDIIGLDDYKDARLPRPGEASPEVKKQEFVQSLVMISKIAQKHGKLPALTETGCETLNIPDWWTSVLMPTLMANDDTRRIAWVEVWRNANAKLEGHEHFFAPYKGHSSASDFVKFHDSPFVLFESELPDMYKEPDENTDGK